MKKYLTLPRSPDVGSHDQIKFSVIQSTVLFGGVLSLSRGVQSAYPKPRRQESIQSFDVLA